MSPAPKNKTQPTRAAVETFLAKEKDPQRRADCEALVTLMSRITKAPAVMWGTSIVGFGQYHYVYESGREGDSMLIGFSPRKAALTIYAMGGVWADPGRLEALGRCTAGGSCLYVKRLADLNRKALERALRDSISRLTALYPPRRTTR